MPRLVLRSSVSVGGGSIGVSDDHARAMFGLLWAIAFRAAGSGSVVIARNLGRCRDRALGSARIWARGGEVRDGLERGMRGGA